MHIRATKNSRHSILSASLKVTACYETFFLLVLPRKLHENMMQLRTSIGLQFIWHMLSLDLPVFWICHIHQENLKVYNCVELVCVCWSTFWIIRFKSHALFCQHLCKKGACLSKPAHLHSGDPMQAELSKCSYWQHCSPFIKNNKTESWPDMAKKGGQVNGTSPHPPLGCSLSTA